MILVLRSSGACVYTAMLSHGVGVPQVDNARRRVRTPVCHITMCQDFTRMWVASQDKLITKDRE
jgi:hypothetical protein